MACNIFIWSGSVGAIGRRRRRRYYDRNGTILCIASLPLPSPSGVFPNPYGRGVAPTEALPPAMQRAAALDGGDSDANATVVAVVALRPALSAAALGAGVAAAAASTRAPSAPLRNLEFASLANLRRFASGTGVPHAARVSCSAARNASAAGAGSSKLGGSL